MTLKALENIEKNIKSIPDISVKKFIDKGKKVMFVASEEISKKQSCVEENMEHVQDLNCKDPDEENIIPLPEISVNKPISREVDGSNENMKRAEEIEVSNLIRALHHYKAQNSHLNHLNDQLVNANCMIR